MNSIYFLTMNIGGDGKDVWPWIGTPDRKGAASNDNLHYDVSKLRQWDLVFAHARAGIALHVVFNEAEAANKRELDDGALGVERKLYYREMIARFGYHPALQWNLCEEYNIGGLDLGADRVREFAKYVRAVDPFDHPLTVHSAGDPVKALAFTFGDPDFDLTSVQINQRRIDLVAEALRAATEQAGRPLPIMMDEFTVDKGNNASHDPRDDAELQPQQKLWPTYLSGGSIEFILEGLLKLDSFKTPAREALWNYVWHAREFLEELPFWADEARRYPSRGGAHDRCRGSVKARPPCWVPRFSPSPERSMRSTSPRPILPATSTSPAPRMAYTGAGTTHEPGSARGRPRVLRGRLGPARLPPQDPDEDSGRAASGHRPARDDRLRRIPGEVVGSETPGGVGPRLGATRRPGGNPRAPRLRDQRWVSREIVGVPEDTKGDIFLGQAGPRHPPDVRHSRGEGPIRRPATPRLRLGVEAQDRDMTFRHLTTMTSGYARPERPGEAWSYNDFAIQLYQKTLFDRVFRADPAEVANHPTRLGAPWDSRTASHSATRTGGSALRSATSHESPGSGFIKVSGPAGNSSPGRFHRPGPPPSAEGSPQLSPPRPTITSTSAPTAAAPTTSPNAGRASTASTGGSTGPAATTPADGTWPDAPRTTVHGRRGQGELAPP